MIVKTDMSSIQWARKGNSLIWDYFARNHENKIAECNLCNKNISYKTTITNLKQHLKLKHINALNEFLSRTPRNSVKSFERVDVSSETRYSSEPEIEFLEESVQNEHEDLYLISPTSTFAIPSESHLVEIKSIGPSQSKPHIRVQTPNSVQDRRKKYNVNMPRSVEALRRNFLMKKCSNLILERKKLLREIENQKEEHDLKIMILQKTLTNLNKI